MASLLPIISDIIPILSPGPVQITKASELDASTGGETDGMVRKGAIVGRSNHVCASIMTAAPNSASAIHHHGEQDTIVYAASGNGIIVTSPKDTSDPDSLPQRHPLSPGDFALIPSWTEHQEINESDAEVTWIVTRSPGGTPVVVNLKGWGKGEA